MQNSQRIVMLRVSDDSREKLKRYRHAINRLQPYGAVVSMPVVVGLILDHFDPHIRKWLGMDEEVRGKKA